MTGSLRSMITRPRLSRASLRGLGAVVVSAAFIVTGCGGGTPSEADFADRMADITKGRVDPDLSKCLYGRLENNPELLDRAMTLENLPKEDDEQMTQYLAECVLDEGNAAISEPLVQPTAPDPDDPDNSDDSGSDDESTDASTTTEG